MSLFPLLPFVRISQNLILRGPHHRIKDASISNISFRLTRSYHLRSPLRSFPLTHSLPRSASTLSHAVFISYQVDSFLLRSRSRAQPRSTSLSLSCALVLPSSHSPSLSLSFALALALPPSSPPSYSLSRHQWKMRKTRNESFIKAATPRRRSKAAFQSGAS